MNPKKIKHFVIEEGRTTFGMHFMLDAYGVPKAPLDNMKKVFRYLNELPMVIGMRKLTAPTVIDCDATESGKDPGGISGTVIIAESHVSIHTFAKRGFFTMDLYSCSDFEDQIEEILNFTKNLFPWSEEVHQLVRRGLRYPVENMHG